MIKSIRVYFPSSSSAYEVGDVINSKTVSQIVVNERNGIYKIKLLEEGKIKVIREIVSNHIIINY